jgi:hypothetical protein
MESAVTILRQFWQQRSAVALFAVVAILIGGLVAYRPSLPPESRQYKVGAAFARILVDTPASQAIEVNPEGGASLGGRASLLANLMAGGEIKDLIARRAGLEPAELITVAPADAESETGASTEPRGRGANVLTTSVPTDDTGVQLPMIDVETQAVDAKRAVALAEAAVAGLNEYLDSKASADKVPDARRLRVQALGAPQGRDVTKGPGMLLAAVATVFVFALFCGMLALIDSIANSWRAASAQRVRERELTLVEWSLDDDEDADTSTADTPPADANGTRRVGAGKS